jgi:hypothetical protein
VNGPSADTSKFPYNTHVEFPALVVAGLRRGRRHVVARNGLGAPPAAPTDADLSKACCVLRTLACSLLQCLVLESLATGLMEAGASKLSKVNSQLKLIS